MAGGWRKVTKYLLAFVAAGLIGYDVIPFLVPERGDTISEVIAFYGMRSFTLPLAFGVLMGHFFITSDGPGPRPKVLFSVAGASILLDIVCWTMHGSVVDVLKQIRCWPVIPLLAGIPFGAIYWRQQRSDKLPKPDKA